MTRILRGKKLIIEIDTATPEADRIALMQMQPNMIQGLDKKQITSDVMDGLKVGSRFQKALMRTEFE